MQKRLCSRTGGAGMVPGTARRRCRAARPPRERSWHAARVLAVIAAALVAITFAPAAQAIPMFARRTGMACSACHEAWPRLNDFGELYRDNGYQLPGRQDTDPPITGDYFPVSVRPALLYQYTLTTNQPSDQGPINVGSGSIQSPDTDLMAGGSLSHNIAALVVVAGFSSDGLASIESAWLRFSNILGTPWLNVRAGMIELDLPTSEHRRLTLTSHHAILHFHPGGSMSTFEVGTNQVGVEIMGHPQGAGFRYALAITSANDNPGTDAFWSSPTGYAHITGTFHPFATFLTRVRLGAFGVFGYAGTRSLTSMATPIAGTFTDHKPFAQAGGEIGFTLGPQAHPFSVQFVAVYGMHDQGLITAGTRAATYAGGFAEVAYTPILRTTVFGRYDMTRSLQSGLAMPAPQNTGDIDGVSLGWRHALLQTWTAAVMAHIEGSWLVTQGAGANGLNQQQFILGGGFDVAL